MKVMKMSEKHRYFLPTALILTLSLSLGYTLFAGGRMFVTRNLWLISRYEKTAIQHPGYDYAPTVLVENETYRMWWCGAAPAGNPYVDHLWTADSVDGLNWSNTQIAMTPNPLALVSDPSVVKVGTTYYMFFTGTSDPQGTANEIYLATSVDGRSWKKYPNDLNPKAILALKAPTGSYGIGQPSVIYRKNRFWMYYTDTTQSQKGLFLASSLDGVLFSAENGGQRILDTNSADVKYSETTGLLFMVHGSLHDKLYFSSSADGLNWEPYHSWHYLAHGANKNKAFEGCLAGSPTGSVGSWTFYYYASHQGQPGKIEDPLSWDIEVGRFSLSAVPAPTTVFQYHTEATSSRGYFYDTYADTPPFYEYERRAFALPTGPQAGLLPFYRLYHPTLKSHFYTSNENEKYFALSLGYQDEGLLGYLSPAFLFGSTPLYRLYHPRGAHLYTIDILEREQSKAYGFMDEGIAGFAWPLPSPVQPPVPVVTPARLSDTSRSLSVSYDVTGVAGSFDSRIEISYANQGFQGNNPSVIDPFSRTSQILRGNRGVAVLSVEGFQAGRYLVRVAALDEEGRSSGFFSESALFEIAAPPVTDRPPFGVMDGPTESSISDGPLVVHGWALDDKGVASVHLMIDGEHVGAATLGFPRSDVQAVYPAFPNAGMSGFRLETNVSRLSTGRHAITLLVVDTSGQSTPVGPRLFTVVNGGNQPPFGVLDVPAEGLIIGNRMWVSGWALDDRGVASVELWVNGLFAADLPAGSYRPDVAAAFPGYPNANSGFYSSLDTTSWNHGTNILRVRICDRQGLCVDLPARSVVK